MEDKDRTDLREAVYLLERPGFGIRVINLFGYPIEGVLRVLPGWIHRAMTHFTARAVGMAFYYALCTLKTSDGRSFRLLHQIMVLVTGAIGGFFGLPGLIVELPISTTIMLRSIAAVARSEGEELSSADTQLACITVFALSGKSASDDVAETAYYAVRAAVTRAVSEAVEYITERGIAEEGMPILIRLMTNLASRFGVVLTDKAVAELVPILGGVGGATINLIFIRHFQAAAQGHFVIRRLERRYGRETVKREYDSVFAELKK